MVALRRSLFSYIAAFAMLCGIGWTTAAYACPEPLISHSADDGRPHSQPVNSMMPYCGPVCLGVVPAIAATGPVTAMHPLPYIVAISTLQSHAYAPDPPPPRGV